MSCVSAANLTGLTVYSDGPVLSEAFLTYSTQPPIDLSIYFANIQTGLEKLSTNF